MVCSPLSVRYGSITIEMSTVSISIMRRRTVLSLMFWVELGRKQMKTDFSHLPWIKQAFLVDWIKQHFFFVGVITAGASHR